MQGAARVIFAEPKSFIKAIKKRFIKMDMLECHKKEIEMKPYVVENQLCDQCEMQTSNLFCIDQQCLQYYCGLVLLNLLHIIFSQRKVVYPITYFFLIKTLKSGIRTSMNFLKQITILP